MKQPQSNEEVINKRMVEVEQRKRDYIATFSSAEGKRVLADLENMCFIHKTTFSEVRDKTLLNEGMRYVVVHIKNLMSMDIEKIKKLMEEE